MICKKCLIDKDNSNFHKRKDSKTGYRRTCKSCVSDYQSEYQSKYYELNKDKISEYKYEYRRTEEYRDKNKNRIDKKHIRISRNFINSTINRIKSKKNYKSNLDLLGYSHEEFKNHIENLFSEGMSWDNHGEWHIDHIIPVSRFDESVDIKIMNSLSNLQPLWAKDNLKKSNRTGGLAPTL